MCYMTVAILDKSPLQGVSFEVPTLPTLGMAKASRILQATWIFATSMKKSVVLAELGVAVVARLARSLILPTAIGPGGVWGWWWVIVASALDAEPFTCYMELRGVDCDWSSFWDSVAQSETWGAMLGMHSLYVAVICRSRTASCNCCTQGDTP